MYLMIMIDDYPRELEKFGSNSLPRRHSFVYATHFCVKNPLGVPSNLDIHVISSEICSLKHLRFRPCAKVVC